MASSTGRTKQQKMKAAAEDEEDAGRQIARELAIPCGDGIFASCSFADLGLHPALCQHLRGFFPEP